MSKRKNRKKNPSNDWEKVGQEEAFRQMDRTQDKEFKQMRKTMDRDFTQMHKTMGREFNAATKDFESVGPTQEDAFTPGRKVTMGSIDPSTAAKKRRKRK